MSLGEINDGRITRGVTTRFNIGPDFGLSLMPEIAPTLALDPTNAEMLYGLGWKRLGGGTVTAFAGAQNSRCRLLLPLVSNVIVVVESLVISTAVAAQFIISTQKAVTAYSNSVGIGQRDSRVPSVTSQPGVCTLSQQTDAAGAPTVNLESVLIPANTPYEVLSARGLVLCGTTSGSALDAWCGTVNQAFHFSYIWRERLLGDQEGSI